MNKLNKKLIARILLVFSVVVIFSFVMNTFFLPKYLLYQKKQSLAALTEQIEMMDTKQLLQDVEVLENEHSVTIVYTTLTDNVDNLNELIKDSLGRKGITLSKFWITDESIEKLNENKIVRMIYNQEKLKSSFLVSFLKKDNQIFVIGESISHSTETLRIVNQFNIYIYVGELLLLILLSGLFTRRIVKPLAQIQTAAEEISKLSFTKVRVQTGDEIEVLAQSINQMSDKLEYAHQELAVKNENLRNFIADISHELKTPLSLIKAYSAGIKDGLDDGTYIDVIEQQTDDISRLVSKLLDLSRLQTDQYTMSAWDFKLLFERTLEKYRISTQQQNIEISVDDSLLKDSRVVADEQKIEMVLNNLITNAVKYTTDGRIHITLANKDDNLFFTIANGIEEHEGQPQGQWDNIWEPFYVLESSRNKQLSGTGLGLSIVRAILQKHDSTFGFNILRGEIEFYFSL